MKKFTVLFLFFLLISTSCKRGGVDAIVPEILSKAEVRIAITDYTVEILWLGFNIVITEHNGVQVAITEIEVQLINLGIVVYQENDLTDRTLLANGKLELVFLVGTEEDDFVDKIRITVKGIDLNGHQILVTQDFT